MELKVLAWPYERDKQLNPYATLLYKGLRENCGLNIKEFSIKRLVLGRWNIVHIHWPDGFWPRHPLWKSTCFALVLLVGIAIARIRGAKLIWTTHNAAAHEQRNEWGRKIYMRLFTTLCDGTISLSQENRKAIHKMYGRLSAKPSLVTTHGLYDNHYPRHKISSEQAKDKLRLPPDKHIVLALGNLRRYKGYSQLIEAFMALPEPLSSDWVLLIAGKSTADAYAEELMTLSKHATNIIIQDAFVPDEDIGLYMNAANVMIFPYRNMQNSGAANLAITFGRTVLAPDINSFKDMARDFPDMVHLFSGEMHNHVLQRGLESLQTQIGAVAPNWQEIRQGITADTCGFYRKLSGMQTQQTNT